MGVIPNLDIIVLATISLVLSVAIAHFFDDLLKKKKEKVKDK